MIKIKDLKKGKELWGIGGNNKPYKIIFIVLIQYNSKILLYYDFDGDITYEYSKEENESYYETKEECLKACKEKIFKKQLLLKEIWEMERYLEKLIETFNEMDWEDDGKYYTENEIRLTSKYLYDRKATKDYISDAFPFLLPFLEKAQRFGLESSDEMKNRKKKFLLNVGIKY